MNAQAAMLNHANVLWTPTKPPEEKAKRTMLVFKGFSEDEKVAIKERGVALLLQFMNAPQKSRIPLSTALLKVARGVPDGSHASEAESEAAEAEADFLEPMPLPGAVDTFDEEGECFE